MLNNYIYYPYILKNISASNLSKNAKLKMSLENNVHVPLTLNHPVMPSIAKIDL